MTNQGQGGSDAAHNFLRTIAKFTEEAGSAKAANKGPRLGLIDYEYDPTDFLGGINPRVIFDGESIASQKRYTVMPPYYPIPGQRVVLLPVGTTYLIIGSVDVVPQDPKVDIFTVTDTWEKPTGARMVRVQCQGGGGAGGGQPATTATQAAAGTGGGGGAYGETWFSANSVAATETVTIGAGGVAVTGGTGGNGGTSSFGSLVSASGGVGGGATGAGTTPSAVNGGDGGGTITADLALPGGGGGSALRIGTDGGALGGAGGNAFMGGGARGKGVTTGTNNGDAGKNYGGGGSGGTSGPDTGGHSAGIGGNGAPGVVIVTTYF